MSEPKLVTLVNGMSIRVWPGSPLYPHAPESRPYGDGQHEEAFCEVCGWPITVRRGSLARVRCDGCGDWTTWAEVQIERERNREV